MNRWAARGAAAFCLGFALFQVALALGAPFGRVAWGGSSAVLPAALRWTSAGAAVYLLLAAAVMEVRAGDWGRDLPRLPFLIFNVFLATQLLLNTFANLATQTAGEGVGMGTASALGCALCLLALKPARRRA
ncbi:MAG: hypothetical protein ACXWKO_09080 [Phenylobacterium sp.]